jgi:hypothetical protein
MCYTLFKVDIQVCPHSIFLLYLVFTIASPVIL